MQILFSSHYLWRSWLQPAIGYSEPHELQRPARHSSVGALMTVTVALFLGWFEHVYFRAGRDLAGVAGFRSPQSFQFSQGFTQQEETQQSLRFATCRFRYSPLAAGPADGTPIHPPF
jgi:hypothetical protein